METFLFFFLRFETIVQGVLLFSFSIWFTGRSPKIRHYVVCLLLFELCNMIAAFTLSSLLSTLVLLLVLYAANVLLLRNSLVVSGLTAMLSVATMQLSYGVTSAPAAMLLPYIGGDTPLSWLVGAIASTLALLLYCGCCYVIIRRFSMEEDLSNPHLLLILTPPLFFCAVGLYIADVVFGNVSVIPYPNQFGRNLALLVVQLLGFGALFSTLYAYRRLCESFRMKGRLALLEQGTHAQQVYVAEAKARYEQTSSFRHDLRNHLTVLDGLLRTAQTEQACAYLEKLKVTSAELSFPVHTGNPVVDILLCGKWERAVQQGIKTDFSLTLPQPCTVDDLDLCIIFSNALDNAVRACALAESSRTICVSGERQGDFYLLEFKNNCPPEQPLAVEMGTGLCNIKSVAEKYGGAMTIAREGGRFCLYVLLNIS